MTNRLTRAAILLTAASITALGAVPAYALSDRQVAAINSGVLDAVESCTFDITTVPDQIFRLAGANLADPREAADVAGAIIKAVQDLNENPSCLFAVGEGITRWALSFGEANSTAISIGVTIGQLGKVPVINACVNTAGVGTEVGLACDPPTSDILGGSRTRSAPSFGSSGENPNQDDPSPN